MFDVRLCRCRVFEHVVLLVVVTLLGAQARLAEVGSLPGLAKTPCFRQWSGYAETGDNGKELFSWVVEAETEPEKKPVVLWLNGGPGCSSLGGMWTELGPFVVTKNHSIELNPYSWNKAATMIFVEQPAGVGFSHPAMDTNDTITANNTYHALLQIFADIPSLRSRPFYIFGESYGGHYVPNTVKAVQDGNALLAADDPRVIDIRGFGVGNGYTDWALDFEMNVHYGREHALCSERQYQAAIEACNGSTVACFWPNPAAKCTQQCDDAVQAATANAMGGAIDIYDIYEDVCFEGKQRQVDQAFVLAQLRQRAVAAARRQRDVTAHGFGTTPISPIYPTCAEDYSKEYLSRADVQEAIHAKRLKAWNMCGLVNEGTLDPAEGEGKTYHFNFESRLPYYRRWLSESKLKILVYSGDADYILNFQSTENWLKALNMRVKKDFVAWKGSDRQVAGYLTEFDGLHFVTVKGAGHMVPKDRPRHALDLFQAFLGDTPIDAIPQSEDTPLCAARAHHLPELVV
eukprot:TRINITY_DN2761_c0_g3_i1.p1 TRINITY_DN2761_c0_g3~~TRINITY_DN2761_c0_g3_i1.p1  ORF type:complete len:516 (-),score=86.82 TRINITY_DN2761_c0_g3_i1:169-1716(-)